MSKKTPKQIQPLQPKHKRGSTALGVVITRNNIEELSANEHKNKGYILDMSTYIDNDNKAKMNIFCPVPGHGIFKQEPSKHIHNGTGCPLCASNTKKTTESFRNDVQELYPGWEFELLSEYVNAKIPITIRCIKHDYTFKPPPSNVTSPSVRSRCIKCSAEERMMTTEKFKNDSTKEHNGYYIYIPDITIFVDYKTKVSIKCPVHGIFEQYPRYHLNGKGCKLCGNKKTGDAKRDTLEKLIIKVNKKYEERGLVNWHDYSLAVYKDNLTDITIICTKHNRTFTQTPKNHKRAYGCELCSSTKAYSEIACEWLNHFRKYTDIKDALNGGELEIKVDQPNEYWTNSILVDGYSEKYNICFEYNGEASHGCDQFDCPNKKSIGLYCGSSSDELQRKTNAKRDIILSKGYHLISIQGCVYEKLRKTKKIEEYVDNIMKDYIPKLTQSHDELIQIYSSIIDDDIELEDKILDIQKMSVFETLIELSKYKGHSHEPIEKKFVLTTKNDINKFIKDGQRIHVDENDEPLYDYSLVHETFGASDSEVKIICKRCNTIFLQRQYSHIRNGRGCHNCNTKSKHTTESRMDEFHAKYEVGHYSYPGFIYNGKNTGTITVVCNIHNHTFYPTVNGHLRGHGCKECANVSKSKKLLKYEEIEKLKFDLVEKNKDKNFIYDLVTQTGNMKTTEIKYICQHHGIMTNTIFNHFRHGCNRCAEYKSQTNLLQDTQKLYINRATRTYKEKLIYNHDYSHIIFKDINTPVTIYCNIHEHTFEVTPLDHMNGITCEYCLNIDAAGNLLKEWISNIKYNLQFSKLVIAGGYSSDNDTYYEYISCYMNGCDNPECKYNTGFNTFLKKTYQELHAQTIIRHNLIQNTGSHLITKRTCDL